MDFVKRNNIRFPELRFAEDVFFYVKAVVLAKDISIINEPLYFYRKQSNSITKNFIAYYQALIDVRREMLDFVESLENKDCYIYPYLIYSINSLIHWYWVAANAKIPNLKYLKEFYTQITLFFSEISKKYDVEKIKNEINYKMFSRFCMHSFEKHHFYSLAKRIVTISNSRDKKRKIISILGMKFKIRKSLFLRKINIS
jgi:hypothetical protein